MKVKYSLTDRSLLPVRPEVQTEHTNNMEKFTIKRDGLPPLVFTGEEIGNGSGATSTGRSTSIRIYRTKGGRFIGVIHRRTQWDKESDSIDAESFTTAAEVITYLKQGNDELGALSQEAVEDAAKVSPEFAEEWIELVE